MTNTRSAAAAGLPAQHSFTDPSTYPDIYGMAVAGGCMAPAYPDGCKVKVSKKEPYAKHDVVVVWLRPEFVKPGGLPAMIKRVVMMPPPWVQTFPYNEHPESECLAVMMLGRDDRPNEMFSVPCSEILAIHKVLGVLAPEEIYKPAPEITRRRAARPRLVRSEACL